MKYSRVIVTGSLSYDYIMSMPSKFKDHIMPDKIHTLNVSFIMKKFRKEFGGTAGNITYSLTLLKIPTLLVGTVGNDFGPYKLHLKKHKLVDVSGIKVYKNISSARGFVMTDSDDNQIWGFFEGAMAKSSNLKIHTFFKDGDFLVIAPNDPEAMVNYAVEAKKYNIPYLFDPAFNIPHIPTLKLLKTIEASEILIGNDYEIELILRRLGATINDLTNLVKCIVITYGSKGSKILTKGKIISVKPAKPKNISDPTGAGDCYRAGFLAGYIKRLPIKVCAQMGSVASVYTVEKYGTQTHKFTLREFSKRFKDNFKSTLTGLTAE